jgi:predicted phage terminase large subunit-like protein
LNDPIDPENADFKASQIKLYDPATAHPSSLYLTIDPAIALSRDADYTAMVVAGMFADRRIRVVDYIRKRVVPSELVEEVFGLVKKWRLHRVGIETFAFQKTLKYDIQRQQRERGVFFSIDELGKRHTGHGEAILSKEARIRRLQPYFEQGLVEIRADMTDLKDELLSFPRGKHDDLIDALSYQLDYLVPSMGLGVREPLIKEGTLGWWVQEHMPESKRSIYDRFFEDLKVK